MNVYEAMEARRTIRDFAKRPIDPMILERILTAGLQAPSHNHLRDWHFVRVESGDQRAALAEFFFSKRTESELRELLDRWGMTDASQCAMYLEAIPRQASMVLGAAELLIPCFRQEEELLGAKQGLHELNAFASIWAVIENVLVAAASEGIHGVTKIVSTPAERDHVRATLRIPEGYEVPCYLPLGYPADEAAWHEQVPVSVADRLHTDRWSDSSG